MQQWHLDWLNGLLGQLRAEPVASKLLATAVLVALIYALHRLLRHTIGRLVSRPETRVKYWNYSRSVWALLGIALVVAVWLEELKTVTLVLAGVLAGVLITNKEVVLGLAGRTTLAIADHYKIGDRIRINGVCGDVINIGLLYTWLLEVDFDGAENQATGRVILVPHMWLTQYAVINSTLGHEYVWDELQIGFPVSVEGPRVTALLGEAAGRFLHREVEEAARGVPRLGHLFAAKDPPVTPIAYARLVMHTSGHQYLVVTVRYVVKVRARRVLHSALTLHLLALLREQGIAVYQNFPYYQAGPAPQEAAEPGAQPEDAPGRPARA
jgi:small-conductance mechanosensitive channel